MIVQHDRLIVYSTIAQFTTNRKQHIYQGCTSPLGGHGQDVPLDALVELGQVYPEVDHRQILDLVLVSQVDLDTDIDTSRAKQ